MNNGKELKIIDLFAGCGGLSLGFEKAGFNIPLAIEKDEWAALTYHNNHKNTNILTADITKITNLDNLEVNHNSINGIIGGPPCQGFSLSGNRDKNDPRNSLFMEFLRFVKYFKPNFFLMENVPGILSMNTKTGEKVTDVITKEYHKIGYHLSVNKLNAAEFGVPQSRVRVLFIGLQENINLDLNSLIPKAFLFGNKQLTIDDAIMDLPQILSGEGIDPMLYKRKPKNNYQLLMREKSKEIHNHIAMRHTQRIIDRFSIIKQGESLADVPYEHGQRKRGAAEKISGKTYSQNNMRPFGNKPSPTIAASFQGNFVHPYLNRNYTAREAARLQSFPDNYIFHGKRTTMSWEKNLSQYQQIGNAVPPLFAEAIAKQLKKELAILL